MTFPSNATPMSQILALSRAAKLGGGLAYILIGISWLLTPTESRMAGIAWTSGLTPQLVGLAWIATGTTAIVIGIQPHRSRRMMQVGWAGLIFVPLVLAIYFLVGWVMHLSPAVDGGSPTGYVSASSYAVMAGMSAAMSRAALVAHRVAERWEAL